MGSIGSHWSFHGVPMKLPLGSSGTSHVTFRWMNRGTHGTLAHEMHFTAHVMNQASRGTCHLPWELPRGGL